MRGRIAIVVSRFNAAVTSRLAANCRRELLARGLPQRAIESFEVPGAYELPWAAQELARSRRYDCLIALGCILRGSTPQNEHIARSVIQHLHDVSLAHRVPVILGVITPKTEAQARARTRGALDRGREAALATIEMMELRQRLRRLAPPAARHRRGGRRA